MIRTLTNMIRSLLFHAHVPLVYWVEALHTATHLINLLPTSRLNFLTPHEAIFRSALDYSHLHVFSCLCYPNVSATAPHKLSPRSIPCVFIGYPSSHKGFRCLDLATGKVIISRHVVFDELSFPFAPSSSSSSAPSSASRRVSLTDIEDNSPLLLSPPRQPITSPSPAPRPSHLRPKSVPPGFPSSPSPADSGPTLSGSNCPAIPNPGPSSSGPNTSPRGPLSSHNPTASSPAPASPPTARHTALRRLLTPINSAAPFPLVTPPRSFPSTSLLRSFLFPIRPPSSPSLISARCPHHLLLLLFLPRLIP